jgi:hypothetical protein
VVWFQVFLKKQLKKKLYWLQLLLLLLATILAGSIHLPGADNCRIGYCYGTQPTEDWLSAGRGASEDGLEFCLYGDEEELRQDVMTGRVDSGFVLPEAFGDDTIRMITSPSSTKGALAKLAVFEACYRISSDALLLEADRQLYDEEDSTRQAELLEKNHSIVYSDRVFTIDLQTVPSEKAGAVSGSECYPVQGTAGLFVMLILLLADADGRGGDTGMLRALPLRRQRAMRIMYTLAAGLPAALVAWLACVPTGRSWWVELLAMLSLLLWTELWLGLPSGGTEAPCIRIVLFLLIQLLICPVFVDLSGWVPALKIIRLFWPLGIDLAIH